MFAFKLFFRTYYENSLFASLLFTPSPVLRLPEKPKLIIDTSGPKTENDGLNREISFRKRAANCEHPELGKFVQGKVPVDCDIAGDFTEEEKGRSVKDRVTEPVKHRATENEGDEAFLCNECLLIICKCCKVDYQSSPETPLPSQVTFPTTSSDEKSIDVVQTDKPNKGEEVADSKKGSLIDDFANLDCEMPDYMGGDD